MTQAVRERSGGVLVRKGDVTTSPPAEAAPGMLGVIRKVGGNLLARPQLSDDHYDLPHKPSDEVVTVTRHLPERTARLMAQERARAGERLLERLDSLYPRPLSASQEEAVSSLSSDARRQFNNVLDALTELKAKRITGARYLFRVLRSAAEISGGDKGRFVELARMSFGSGAKTRSPAEAVSAELLERLFLHLAGTSAGRGGFNENLLESHSTRALPHLFGSFLDAGKNRWGFVGHWLLPDRDPTQNAGEVRCAQFALMVGRGLRAGKLTPEDVVHLTRWAFAGRKPNTEGPPWGHAATPGRFLSVKDYKLDAWRKAFADAGSPQR